MLVRAFEYFSCSRAAYELFRKDHQLPSVKTLTRITSRVNNTENLGFLKKVLDVSPNQQKQVVLLVDEIYVKPSISYHGGKIFGKAENNSAELAKTILAIMLKCLMGGPEFIIKMIPVSRLTSDFQYNQVQSTISQLQQCEVSVIAIICDGNQVKRTFFKQFDTVPKKPWLSNRTYYCYSIMFI